MVLVDDVMINIRASVMMTPVRPAKYVKATYRPPSGFCEINTHRGLNEENVSKLTWAPSVFFTSESLRKWYSLRNIMRIVKVSTVIRND